MGKNSYHWAISYMAASIIGIVVPIDKELHSSDVINFLNVSEASCILADEKYISSLLKEKSEIKNNLTFINFNSEKTTDEFISFSSLIEDGDKLVEEGDNLLII